MQFIQGKKVLFFIAVPACLTGIVFLANIGWFFFFNPLISDSRVTHIQTVGPGMTIPEPEGPVQEKLTAKQPIETPEDLEEEFNRFLEKNGAAGESRPAEAGTAREMASYGDEAKESFVQQAIDSIPQVGSVRVPNEGEVWMQLQPGAVIEEGGQEMLASAARIYQETMMTDQPVKIVVWRGNQPALVRTFFGPPVF